ncbi:MAG: pilus assembly protein PilM [Planctomycetes bacterium]|nr:pilus assembly protein PilM [Planctomycetota bacterium]
MVKVVELDGSYRKTRLLRANTTAVASATEDPMRPDLVAAAVRAAIDEGMKGSITLGHPCREAVLRGLELPFKGTDAIRKIVKSEIEGEIYTHAVDDMIVDFHEIGPGASGGTRVLVASVPKVGLRNQLGALSAEKVDPEFVDLDTMALWRAAHWAGCFAAADADEAAAAPAGEAVHAVVDIGARSVKVVLVEGEQLVEMRALRLGDGVVAEHVARHYGLPVGQAQEAVRRCLEDGADCEFAPQAQVDGALAAVEGELGVEPAPQKVEAAAIVPVGEAIVVSHTFVGEEHTRYLQRLARELTRFLTATGLAARVRSVWMTGGACSGQGVAEMLAAVFGHEPQLLDPLTHLAHDLDEEEAQQLGPSLTTAIGLALAPLGGPEGFQLRQEDLALTRGFERIKFSLAICCMVGLLALFVHANSQSIKLRNLELQIGKQFVDPKDPESIQFFGMLNPLFNDAFFRNKDCFETRKNGRLYGYKELAADVIAAPVQDRVRIVRDRLRDIVEEKQKATGVYEDVSMESGLAVLVRWAEILKGAEPRLGRYLVPRVDLNMKGKARKLEFWVAFRGDDFRARGAELRRAFENDYQKPDSPFKAPDRAGEDLTMDLFQSSSRNPADQAVNGAYYKFTISVKERFEPFGISRRTAAADLPTPRREPGLLATTENAATKEGR